MHEPMCSAQIMSKYKDSLDSLVLVSRQALENYEFKNSFTPP